MSETRYSLCVTYPNKNYPDHFLFFRVADYDVIKHSFTPASYTPAEENYFIYDPKIIGARSKEATANLTVIREWEVMGDDDKKSISSSYPGTAYEVVFPNELKGANVYDPRSIREILHNGISIDENAGNNLLVVIGSSPTQYVTLYCPKNSLTYTGSLNKVPSNMSDMIHSLHYLEQFEIERSDVFDTDNLVGISLPDGRKVATRYFYSFTELPSKKCNFPLFDFTSYIPQYVSKYLKKEKAVLQLTNNDIRKITACIEEILGDYNQLGNYFSITGYDLSNLEVILSQYVDDICKALLGDTEADRIIYRCVLQSDDAMQKCIETVRSQWLEERNGEKEAIVAEIEELRQSAKLESKKRDEIILSVEIADKRREQIENDILQIEEEIQASQERLIKINSEIERELKSFSKNIVHNVALCSVLQGIGGDTVMKSSPIHSYISIPKNLEGSDAKIANKDDLEDSLAENLSTSGFEAKSIEIAQLISHCIYSRAPLIISGNGMIIANCLSVLFSDKGSAVVNIPVGYTNLADITEKISSISESVVYITGVFDGFSENVFHAIKNSCDKKIVFVSADGVDVGILSPAVWSSAYFLDGDAAYDYCEKEIITSATVEKLSFEISYKANEIKEKKKLLKPLIEAGILCNTAAIQYSKFMVDINSDLKSDWLLLLQLCVNAKAMHKTEELTDLLETLGVDEKRRALLKKYL